MEMNSVPWERRVLMVFAEGVCMDVVIAQCILCFGLVPVGHIMTRCGSPKCSSVVWRCMISHRCSPLWIRMRT